MRAIANAISQHSGRIDIFGKANMRARRLHAWENVQSTPNARA
jgi:hypothetical protein